MLKEKELHNNEKVAVRWTLKTTNTARDMDKGANYSCRVTAAARLLIGRLAIVCFPSFSQWHQEQL